MLNWKFSGALIGLLVTQVLSAQTFSIGHISTSYYDSDRDRDVTAEVYYPADNSGDGVPLAEGDFHYIVFGHGFLMEWNAYQNFWEELVPDGYVMCFATTEMGVFPNHGAFGEDLRFLVDQLQLESDNENSIFFNGLTDQVALMGHSMGGGASFLAAANNPSITTLVNFAAAETDPSAIAASEQIFIPSLLFLGDADCVTPPEEHQDPLYEALASECKAKVGIIDGVHCYFANDNFNCTLGESFCNPVPDISREEQQAITFEVLKPWLEYTLDEQEDVLPELVELLDSSNVLNYESTCFQSVISGIQNEFDIELFPNPFTDRIQLELPESNGTAIVKIFDLSGKVVFRTSLNRAETSLDLSHLDAGLYMLQVENMNDDQHFSKQILKLQ